MLKYISDVTNRMYVQEIFQLLKKEKQQAEKCISSRTRFRNINLHCNFDDNGLICGNDAEDEYHNYLIILYGRNWHTHGP